METRTNEVAMTPNMHIPANDNNHTHNVNLATATRLEQPTTTTG